MEKIIKAPMLYCALLCCTVSVFSFYNRIYIWALVLVVATVSIFFLFKDNYKVVLATALVIPVLLSVNNVYSKIDAVKTLDNTVVKEQFVATADISLKDNYSYIEAKCVSGKELPNGLKITIYYYGNNVVLSGQCFESEVKIRLFDGNNTKKSFYANGEYLTGTTKSFTITNQESKFYGLIGKVRRYVKKSIFQYLSGDTAGLLIAISDGDKSYLSDMLLGGAKISGISHVLVVSGMHLSILLGGIFSVINRLFKNKYLHLLLCIGFTVFLSSICGFSISVVRASLMYVVSALAPVFNRDRDSLNSLGIAVYIILLFNPFAVFSVAFMLSSLATYSVIELSPFYTKVIMYKARFNSKFMFTLLSLICNAFFAVIMTLPVLVVYYGYVSLVSIITNILITYAISAALSFTALALIIPEFFILSGFRQLLMLTSGLFAGYVIEVVTDISLFPFASVNMGKYMEYISLLFVGLFIALKIIKKPKYIRKFIDKEVWYANY